MSAFKLSFLLALASAFVTSATVRATTLIGTQVTGVLYIAGNPANYFDPANHWVPAGYLNAAGTTVTISSNAVEFGYFDGTTTITADFGKTHLVVKFSPVLSGNYLPIQLAFTNSAFSSLSPVSDNFPYGGSGGLLSGNVISLNWMGGYVTNGQILEAVFGVNLPSAPPLSIQLTPTNTVVLSWPATSTDFTLQQNSTFNPADWVNVTNTTAVANGQNQVIVSRPVGTQFYRLKYP
jgi:hypothetical protein